MNPGPDFSEFYEHLASRIAEEPSPQRQLDILRQYVGPQREAILAVIRQQDQDLGGWLTVAAGAGKIGSA